MTTRTDQVVAADLEEEPVVFTFEKAEDVVSLDIRRKSGSGMTIRLSSEEHLALSSAIDYQPEPELSPGEEAELAREDHAIVREARERNAVKSVSVHVYIEDKNGRRVRHRYAMAPEYFVEEPVSKKSASWSAHADQVMDEDVAAAKGWLTLRGLVLDLAPDESG